MAELPIACTLEAAEFGERAERWRRFGDKALIGMRPTAQGITARFRSEPAAARELDELVRLERECCGFARWTVHPHGDELRLEVRAADPLGAASLRAMFDRPGP